MTDRRRLEPSKIPVEDQGAGAGAGPDGESDKQHSKLQVQRPPGVGSEWLLWRIRDAGAGDKCTLARTNGHCRGAIGGVAPWWRPVGVGR